MARIALIDLSGIFRAKWHATDHEEVSEAFRRTLNDVYSFARGYDHVGICIDKPPYKRKEIDPDYKAHRDKAPAVMYEQLRQVIERLREDGHHIFGADGYEADDIIGALCEWAEEREHETTVYSGDKDLMQLVTKRTCVISTGARQKYDQRAVVEKFGVHPELIPDWLALAGDKSDGIAGVRGCGPKKAAAWIGEFGDLAGVLENASLLQGKHDGAAFADTVSMSKELISRGWRLAQLMIDCPINPEEILKPMERKEKPAQEKYDGLDDEPATMQEPEIMGGSGRDQKQDAEQGHGAHHEPEKSASDSPNPEPSTHALVKPEYAPTSWDKSLEPRDPRQAWGVAQMLHRSRLFGSFDNPEAILAIVMTGRSFGMDTTSSLRGFHMIKGKVSPSSQLLIGLVKRHPACEWFRLVESTPESALWETKRKDEPEPTRMKYTIDDARLAGLAGLDQWKKRAKTMLRWRAGVELARAVYPDIVSGLYTIEEMEERG